MAKKCDLGNEVLSEIEQIMEDEFKENEHAVETVVPKVGKYKEFYRNLREFIISNANDDNIGLESVESYIRAQYSGNEEKRMQLAVKLRSILNANPVLLAMFQEEMMVQIGQISNANPMDFVKDGQVILENLPVPVLTYLLNHAMEFTGAKQFLNPFVKRKKGAVGFVRGQLDRISLNLGTPRTNRFKDTTGAVFTMYQAAQEYVSNVSKNISRYLSKDIRGKRNYGIDDVFENIKNLALIIPKSNTKTRDALSRVFTRYMQGEIIIKNGKMYMHQSWSPVYDSKGNIMRYPETNDIMYDWANTIPIEEAMPNLNFNVNQFALAFEREKVRAAKIYKEIWTNTIKTYQKQETDLLRILKKSYFPAGTDINTIRKIIFKEEWKPLVAKEFHERIEFLRDTFTQYSLFEPFLYQGQAQVPVKGKNKNAWPIMYHSPLMMVEWMQKEEAAKVAVVAAENEYGEDPSSANKLALKEARSRLKYRTRQMDRMAGIAINSINDSKVITRGQAATFKSITNDFDLSGPMKRDDESVIYDYLRANASQIARNELINKLLMSYALAGNNAVVKDEVIQLWKTTMNRMDVKSQGITPLDTSPANISRWINWAGKSFKIQVSPHQVDLMLKRFSQWFTALKLGGVSTAEVNATAAILKMNQYSAKRLAEAMDEYDNNTALWDELIAESGILSFGDFFSKGLISNLTGTHEIAERDAKEMVRTYFIYYKEKETLGNVQAEINLRAAIGGIVKNIPSIKRLKQVNKALYRQKMNAHVSKFANFAITKEFRNLQVVRTLPDVLFDKGQDIIEWWSRFTLQMASMPTMGETEKNMRSHSFLIAALSLRDKSFFKGDFSNLSENERKMIINYGRVITDLLDFGLSQQSVGRIYRGSFGSLRGRFKFWATQKWRFDLNVVKNYYRSIANVNRGDSFDWKAMGKMGKTFIKMIPHWFTLGTTASSTLKKMRADSHIEAQYAHFMAYSVPMTLLLDIFLFGPLGRKAYLRLVSPFFASKGFYKKAAGLSSDMISLFLSLPLMFGMALKGDTGDDEDEWGDIFDRLLRSSYEGFGTAWFISFLEFNFSLTQDDDEMKLKKAQEFMNINVPAGTEKLMDIKKIMQATDDILED